MKKVFLTFILSAGIAGAYAQTTPGAGTGTPTDPNTNPSTITPNTNGTLNPGTPNTGTPNNSINNNSMTTPIAPSDTAKVPSNTAPSIQNQQNKSTAPKNSTIGQ
ncbi:hypothetical protein [Cytophaga aurantiaca]|uniref:hypothetical protein n=1 Tax=Cytophaga aurantiaca TaxID=29530 RepID=UPI00036B8B28|nr:hypothetical protein [Cytophaga aurantiaca]